MKMFIRLLIFIFFLSSCCSMEEAETIVGQGASYISCESTPWAFNWDDLVSCVYAEPAPSELNPSFACAFSSIQDAAGEVEIQFSEDVSSGRLHVINRSTNIILQDVDRVEATEVFINDGIPFYILFGDRLLRLTIENVYIGGCFHELIRWEELN